MDSREFTGRGLYHYRLARFYVMREKVGSGRTSMAADCCAGPGAVTCPSKPITVRVAVLEVPPPGAALKTVMLRWPRVRMSLLDICA